MNSVSLPKASWHLKGRWHQSRPGPAHHLAVQHLQCGHTRLGPSLSRVSFGLIFLPLLFFFLLFKLIVYQWTKKLGRLITFLSSSFIEKIHTPDSLHI